MYLDIIAKVDSASYEENALIWKLKSHDGTTLGKVTEAVVERLKDVEWIHLASINREVKIIDPSNLDQKFSGLVNSWRQNRTFSCLEGWRDELYTCYSSDGSKYFSIERSAAALFGIVTYGCHINGYCPKTKQIWVPRRSSTKQTYPNMLDNTVAGGLGGDLTFEECAIKECAEEAGLSADYVRSRLIPAGAVTYEFVDPETKYYQPEVECIYDLVMDPPAEGGPTPKPVDGEAQDFTLLSYESVKQKICAGEFKYNCALVLVDFFIRHGEISVETEPDYFEIVSRCHRRLAYPLKKLFL